MRKESNIYSRYFTYIKPVARLPIVKTYGSTIFTLIVTAIFIIYAIKPTLETILVLQKKLTEQNEVLQKVNQKATNLSLAKQNFEKLDPEVKNKIEAAVPSNAGLKSVTQTLELAAGRNEASISALQVQPVTFQAKDENQLGTLSEVEFTFNVEGEYKKLITLLQDLRTSDRLIFINNLSISAVTEGKGLIMSVSGKAYYLK